MGKGKKALCSIWNGEKIGYIEARKKIYIPIYAKAAVKSQAYKKLKQIYDSGKNIVLWDFDGYDYQSLGMTLDDVINCKQKKMGHAFVLAALLTKKCIVERNTVTLNVDDNIIHPAEKNTFQYEQQSLFPNLK